MKENEEVKRICYGDVEDAVNEAHLKGAKSIEVNGIPGTEATIDLDGVKKGITPLEYLIKVTY